MASAPLRSRIIGLAGTLVLVLGMTGLFQVESARAPGGDVFDVSWVETRTGGPGGAGALREGQTRALDLPIETVNVSRAAWALAWSDPVGDPDAFVLRVVSPEGEVRTAEGREGRLGVAFDLDAPPGGFRLQAASAAEAHARVAAEQTGTRGVGSWLVEVTLVEAPGLFAGGVEVQGDGENAWTLSSSLTTYRADVDVAR